jgi:hypothetical protein
MQLLYLSGEEADIYRDFREERRGLIDQAVSGHSVKKASQLIIETLLRTRLFCNNGPGAFAARNGKYLELPSDPLEALSYLQANGKATCAQCDSDVLSLDKDDDDSGMLTTCQHLICGACVAIYLEDLQDNAYTGCIRCPQCGQNGKVGTTLAPSPELDPAACAFANTKLQALIENIRNQRDEDKW